MTSIVEGRPAGRRETHNAAAGPRFGLLVRSEWVKFRTVRGWVVGMVVAILLMLFVGVFLAGNASIGCGPNLSGKACLPAVPVGPGGEAVTDSFYFVHRPLTGDGSITIGVTSLTGTYTSGLAQVGSRPPVHKGLEGWAKAGLIIRASTRPGSAYAAMMVTGGHGVRMQYDFTGDIAGLAGNVGPRAPRWLRLVRAGDTVTGYDSADGSHWDRVGAVRLPGLPATVQAGMFAATPPYVRVIPFFGGATNQGGPAEATATYADPSLRGAWPAATWTAADVGAGRLSPGTDRGSVQRTAGGGYVISGSGDIAPMVPGALSAVPTATFERPLTGVIIGLIAVVVVAAMFVTAEYRRQLIRLTLAATPRRGQVLAAKAVVIGAIAFVAGLAAAVPAIFLGLPRIRNEGLYILPVSALTEVRVLGGTAALVAVAAVLAAAIGMIVRRSAAAVTAVIASIVLPYLLAVTVLPAGVADWVLRVTPAAGFAVQQSIPDYPQVSTVTSAADGTYPLPPWAGFGVLCIYAVAALTAAAVLLRRRDA